MKNLVLVGLLLIAQQCMGQRGGPNTCEPSMVNPLNPLNPGAPTGGFEICLFNSTNNLATSLLAMGANNAWAIQNALVNAGHCYCRQDCTPSQIVCEDPSLVSTLLNTLIPGLANFSVANGVAQFVYVAEQWNFYCYCKDLAGDTPCAAPPNPSVCNI